MAAIAELIKPATAPNAGMLPPSLMRRGAEKKYPSQHDREVMFHYHTSGRTPERVALDVFDSCVEHDPLFEMGFAAPCANGEMGWYAFETHTAPYGGSASRVSCTIYVLSVLREQQAGLQIDIVKDIIIDVPGFGAHRVPLTWNNAAFMLNASNHNMYPRRSWNCDIEACRKNGKYVPNVCGAAEPSAIIEVIKKTVHSAYKAE